MTEKTPEETAAILNVTLDEFKQGAELLGACLLCWNAPIPVNDYDINRLIYTSGLPDRLKTWIALQFGRIIHAKTMAYLPPILN
jgi:hypothetical protein